VRNVLFNDSGKLLFSTSTDKSIKAVDINKNKTVIKISNAHK
jgi:hypothetical protein